MKHLISWASIPSSDFDRAVNFYSAVTGKSLEVKGEGDQRMATSLAESDFKENIVGFGVTADPTITPGPSGPRLYLAIEDMEGFLGRVDEAGGKIITPKSAMGEMGFWGLIEDSEGNQIGLHSTK
ncbi:glyoxalase [Candidatus Wolfebacteria bacterium]|nr:MAG: glyoxalase [Candidatus Wolfebacteria bacterium]